MKLYRALLHLYPASFRREYAGPMTALFAERLHTASRIERLWLWAEALYDVARNALPAHAAILRQDLHYTARTLRRAPGFAAAAIAVAALGIGANTAVFTIADHVLVRPLPFAEPHRLVRLWESPPGYRQMELSPPNYRDWKAMATSFEEMAAWRGLSVNVTGYGDPQRLDGASVEAAMFPMLGVSPEFGRLFTAEDDREGAPGTLLLSYPLWQRAFGGDRGVLGMRLLLDGNPYTVIGVMRPGFHFPNARAELWTPMRFVRTADFADRNNNYLDVVARLKPGVSLDQARNELSVIAARLEKAYPNENARTGAFAILMRDELSQRSRLLLGALIGAALCVLLIACANLASLMLARAASRAKEMAVRNALGAGRERLLRQLLTESLLLAALGGALGVALAYAVVPLLARLVPSSLPIAETPSIDPRVWIAALALTAATGLAFGILPAIRASGAACAPALHEGSRAGVGGRRERLRGALVTVEVTLSVVLLVSAGLLLRALWNLQSVDPGFRPEGVLTLRTSLSMPKYNSVARRDGFYRSVLDQVRALPGVTHAAYISFLPMAHRGGIWAVSLGDRLEDRAGNNTASLRFVTPGFFEAMGIPLRQGRDVSEADTRESLFTAVVSESFARRYWPDQDPLGKRFRFAFFERTVVGVAGNVMVRGIERSSEPQVYLPYRQVPDGGLTWYAPKDLVVRAQSDPMALAPAVRRIVHGADSEQPVSDVRLLDDIVAGDTAPRRVQVRVLGGFALVALLLAGVGIHGLLAFMVAQRRQEIGVRVALGASSRDILSLVLHEGLVLAAVGAVAGVAGGYAAGRWMQALLAGVDPFDATVISSAVAAVVAMALAGTLLPAIRAIRVDPLTVIRAE